ncbi:LETM1-like protein [Corchorus olitorius]|uniref:LETM1-like protein n=1 Tax=Corchorus olitorius TaxID=93759 RepID=A0A1R3HLG9_9ROSI|nr:LETM1-like protein [Corchorus olitorius]
MDHENHILNLASSSASTDAITFGEGNDISKPNPLYESLIRKYSIKLISTTADVWLGTQLLCIDIMASMELLLKQLCGQKLRAREKRKLKRTFNDIATLIPVTILMLIPGRGPVEERAVAVGILEVKEGGGGNETWVRKEERKIRDLD